MGDFFGGQSGQRGFAAAVGPDHDSPRQRSVLKSNVELLQGGRMLRNVPSNRHRRIVVRATPAAAR